MAKAPRSLAIDIGSTGLRVAEFEYPPGGGLIMHSFEYVEYTEHLSDANRTLIITGALQKALAGGHFTTTRAAACISGQAAFMRFVKLPPVAEEETRIQQIVEYEARQNVPFPIEEVIWDYQLISGDDEELEVMFVVVKNEIVESVIEALGAAGLKTVLVDFAPAALYNVARANHVGDNECAMVLNIGGRSSSLLFIEGNHLFVRTIPIAGFTVTQQIAKEFSITTEEAEVLKRRHGFVALGGAYEEPESEVAATISKIVRNVMTRLHGEINRSINVYRTQQKGSKPSLLYLSGGSSTMAFTNEFFQEKLRMEVNYLNPFKIVSLSDSIDIKQLQDFAHMFPETVGVGLRNSVECPVEVSLVPESLRSQQVFARKKPYLVAAALVLLTTLLVLISVNYKKIDLYRKTAKDREETVQRLRSITKEIDRATAAEKRQTANYRAIADMLGRRYVWMDFYNALQLAKPRDIWLDSVVPVTEPVTEEATKKTTPTPTEEAPSMFFPGPGRPEAANPDTGAASGGEEAALEAYEWFEVVGHAISIPGRKVFTEAQVEQFAAQAAERLATEKAGAEDATAALPLGASAGDEEADDVASAKSEWRPDTYDDPRNTVPQDMSKLPEIFLDSLRESPFFDADLSMTQIVSYKQDERVKNHTMFQIRLKLTTPIRTKW